MSLSLYSLCDWIKKKIYLSRAKAQLICYFQGTILVASFFFLFLGWYTLPAFFRILYLINELITYLWRNVWYMWRAIAMAIGTDFHKLNTTLFPDELSEALAALVKKLKQMARPWKWREEDEINPPKMCILPMKILLNISKKRRSWNVKII